MKKAVLGAALTLAAAFNAHAQDANPAFHFLVGAGITYGGDTLETVSFTDGSSEDIKGGGLVHLYFGGEFRVADKVSLQGTVGYHVDDTSAASNGSVRFSRIPVDLLAYYHVNDHIRIGGGVQYVNGPELKGRGVASNVHVEFKNAIGTIIEGEYLFTPHMGVKLRYVAEEFETTAGATADGNHVGAMFSYYF